MKRLILLIAGLSCSYGQIGFPGPVQILPSADETEPKAIELLDTTRRFVGFIAPTAVTDIVVDGATAADPMVLTLASNAPPTVVVGGTVTLSGAMGAGCSGMDATHDVTMVIGTSVTIDFDGTGCTYTASSATMETSFYWELPPDDGGSGECLGWSSSYVLTWITCSAAGSTPPFVDTTDIIKGSSDATKLLRFEVDGFTTATTRTLTPQDANYTIAGTNIPNTFSADQTLSGSDLLCSGTCDVGSSGSPMFGIYGRSFVSNASTLQTAFQTTSTNIVITGDGVILAGPAITLRPNGGLFSGRVRMEGVSSGSYVVWQANDSTADYTLVLPDAQGALGETLVNDGSGNLSWSSSSGANTALSNLTSPTSVNQDLIPSGSKNIGSSASRWTNVYAGEVNVNNRIMPDTTFVRDIGQPSTAFNSIYGQEIFGESIRIASPGSALSDAWYLSGGTTGIMWIFEPAGGVFARFSKISGNNATWASNHNPGTTNTYNFGSGNFHWKESHIEQMYAWDFLRITNTSSCTWGGTCWYYGFKSPTSPLTANAVWELPHADGTSVQCWGYSASFTLGWKDCGVAASGSYSITGDWDFTSGSITMSAGNFYARSFAGSGISCSGVDDGWMGWDTSGQYLIMCAGGSRYRVALTAY